MAILMLMELEGGTREQYDAVDEIMGGVTVDNAPEGLISHSAAITEDGLVIADVWESPEALQAFFETRLGPALQQAEVPQVEPRILPVHNHIHGSGLHPGVVMIAEVDGMTTDDYDRMTDDIEAHGGDGSAHPSVSHVAATDGDTLVVVDIWESEEAFGQFAESEIAPRAGASMDRMSTRFGEVHNHVPVKTPAPKG
jgi:heme-degrading monooxygenase HmoA